MAALRDVSMGLKEAAGCPGTSCAAGMGAVREDGELRHPYTIAPLCSASLWGYLQMRFLQNELKLGKILPYLTSFKNHFSLALDMSILGNFKAGNRTSCVHTQEMSPNKKWACGLQFRNWMEAIQDSLPVLLEKNLVSC